MKVVVTGQGAVTPLGLDAPSTLDGLFAGASGIRERRGFALAGARSLLAAEVEGLEGGAGSRADRMAIRAAREALADAGIVPADLPTALVVGGTTAGMYETETLLVELASEVDVVALPEVAERLRTHPLSATADALHEALGPFQTTRTVCCACTSGAAAIALGEAWIRAGRAERVLVGGVDALCRLTVAGFGALGVLDPAPSRPFDRTRAGLSLGEAAAFLVLERADLARARGARVRATLLGTALGGEAHHITNPEPTGAAATRIVRASLEAAGCAPGEVGYVNAHGTGTPHNDAAESRALRAVFGDVRVLVSSSKGQLGHTLGAAGAIEGLVAMAAIERGVLPRTAGLAEADPACDVDHVAGGEAIARPAVVLSTSFGFGGTGGAVVFGEGDAPARPDVLTRALVVTGLSALAGGAILGVEAAARLDGSGEAFAPQADPTDWLDPARSRRMDRTGRLVAALVGRALEGADLGAQTPLARQGVAAVAGTASGNVDGSMRFMKRVLEKGAGLASPADFPNLVPSSPVSHAAIAWGLGGPAIASPDLSASAEAAFATGLELVAAGAASAAVAGSVEEPSALAERVLAPVLGARPLGARAEGGAVFVIEPEADAVARGAPVLARVLAWSARREQSAVGDVPGPCAGAIVVAEPHVDLPGLLRGSAWAACPRRAVSIARAGEHLGLGGLALALGVAALASGDAPRVLVVGEAPGRSYAFVFDAGSGLRP